MLSDDYRLDISKDDEFQQIVIQFTYFGELLSEPFSIGMTITFDRLKELKLSGLEKCFMTQRFLNKIQDEFYGKTGKVVNFSKSEVDKFEQEFNLLTWKLA